MENRARSDPNFGKWLTRAEVRSLCDLRMDSEGARISDEKGRRICRRAPYPTLMKWTRRECLKPATTRTYLRRPSASLAEENRTPSNGLYPR